MRIDRVSFLCFIVFLVLKLCGAVDWSWGFILMPFVLFAGACCREAELEKALGRDLTDL